MNGAHIMMGLNYGGGMVKAQEHIIDAVGSAFRHWSTPVASGDAKYLEMDVSEGCYSV